MIRSYIQAIGAYGTALRFIAKHRLWGYVIIPSIIAGLLVYGLFFLIIWGWSDNIGNWLTQYIQWIPSEKIVSWLEGKMNWVGGLLLGILSFLVSKQLLIALMSPFMSPLSEKVERILFNPHQVKSGLNLSQLGADLWRGIQISLRNIIRELFYTLLLLLLSLFAILAPFTSVAIFLVQAYYAGFGNMDYTLERKLGVKESARFVRSQRGLALGNGTIFMLLLMIPLLGVFIAPPLATVASSLELAKIMPPTNHESSFV